MIRTETVSPIQHKHSETYLVDKHWKVIFTLTEKRNELRYWKLPYVS